jgi:hypothetical protein
MTKHFIFTHETYWTDQGCSCCETWEWDLYNCLSHELNGSCSNEQDCLLNIVEHLDYDNYLEFLNLESDDVEIDDLVIGYLTIKGVTWEFIDID